ncbi:hypothetical protein DFH09DRAFT_1190462 [Mycena vulgaris]|nr:hypothetical protein DFH09DRAFT_1190462 [Mycena vulgaris]
MVLNCFTMHHNEERYPDSSLHIQPLSLHGDDLSCAESAKLSNVMERDHWTFGAGRRICPGLAVAEREFWLAIFSHSLDIYGESAPVRAHLARKVRRNVGPHSSAFQSCVRAKTRNVHETIVGIQEIKV